jgi:trans-aconitate 2-methyltransferase
VAESNSRVYLEFERERTRAARDLLAHIEKTPAGGIFDLGCGPGNSTELLCAAFPNADVVGVDLSPDMLASARLRLPCARFVEGDIETWSPSAPAGLIFANASLQFVADHRERLIRLVDCLADGGVLAAQMPDNIHEISHALMRMVAADGPWADRLVPIAKTRMLVGPVESYYELLKDCCAQLDIWRTTYVHPLKGVDDIVRWFQGSALQPFLDALDDDEQRAFLSRYRNELAEAYPLQSDGRVLLHYPRLFIVLRK